MNKLVLLVFLAFCFVTFRAFSNDNIDIYKIWIEYENEDSILVERTGYFYNSNDTTVAISNSSYIEDYINNDFQFKHFNSEMLQKIKIRKKNKVSQYAFWGYATGFAAGALLAIIDGDDKCGENEGWCLFNFSWQQKIVLIGLPMATLVGLPTGAVIGSKKDVFITGADQSKYLKYKESFEQYSIKKQMKNPPPEEIFNEYE